MELSSICLSMVSANLDTLANTLIWVIAHMGKNQQIQNQAYKEIRKVHGDSSLNFQQEKVPYLVALCKESLRYFTVLKLGLPRRTIEDSKYGNHVIPAGTTVFYNAFAINRDPQRYSSPEEFNPERFLNEEEKKVGHPHYTFGVGTRMCVGNLLADREMYMGIGGLIDHFEIQPENNSSSANYDTNPRTACANPLSLASIPRPFKVRFVPRNPAKLEAWLKCNVH